MYPANKLNISKNLLIQLYVVDNKTSVQIGKLLNCTYKTILNYLKVYNICRNSISEGTKLGMTKQIKMKIKKALKGCRHSPETEFKRGSIPFNKGKSMSKEQKEILRRANLGKKLSKKTIKKIKKAFHKHHKDLNRKNNNKENLLKIKGSKHIKLHYSGYRYLVETGQIDNYIKWFDKRYGLK